jgi:hypothetical protein
VLPDEVVGIPLHPLIVHAAVVLVPLAALGTLLITVVPRWRSAYGWLVVATSGVAVVTVPLATRTGRRLTELREFGGPVLERIQQHEAMGDRVIWAVVPMFLLNLVAILALRAGRPARHVTVVAALASVAAVAAVVLVVLTGHLGSMAVWNPTG